MSEDELLRLVAKEPVGTFLLMDYHTSYGKHITEIYTKIGVDMWCKHSPRKSPTTMFDDYMISYALDYIKALGCWSMS